MPDGNGNAVVTWTTDEPSDSLVQYGTAPGALNLSVSSTAFDTPHTITLDWPVHRYNILLSGDIQRRCQ